MMEILEKLYEPTALVFVLTTMISMGLGLTISEVLEPLKNKRFIVMALLVNFVVLPAFTFLLLRLIPMDESLGIGLLLVSLAAGAPALPKLAEFSGGDKAASVGLMVLLILGTIIILPLILPLLLSGVAVTFMDIAPGLIILIFIPLALSLFIRNRSESKALKALPVFEKLSSISMLVILVMMVIIDADSVVKLAGSGGLLASVILIIATLAAGYLLGGKDKSIRLTQSFGAGQRNIAAAVVVVTLNFSENPNVMVMVVSFALLGMVFMVPMAIVLGKRQKAQLSS